MLRENYFHLLTTGRKDRQLLIEMCLFMLPQPTFFCFLKTFKVYCCQSRGKNNKQAFFGVCVNESVVGSGKSGLVKTQQMEEWELQY